MWKFIAAVIAAYLTVFITRYPPIEHAHIVWKIIGFVLAVFVAGWGIRLGERVRNLIMPDIMITDGSMNEVVKARLFWAIGFQAIGCFLGAFIFTGIFFHFVGPSSDEVAKERTAINKAKDDAIQAAWNKEHANDIANYKVLSAVSDLTTQADHDKEQCQRGMTSLEGQPDINPCVEYKELEQKIRQKGVCWGPASDPEYNKHWVRCVNM